MPYRLRQIAPDDKMCQQVRLDVVDQLYPVSSICTQLEEHDAWEQHERSLNMLVLVHLLLAAALWTRDALPRVLERLARPLHLLGLPLKAMQVTAGAICSRRRHLGVAPLRGLFAQHCCPLCSPATKGAYRFGNHPPQPTLCPRS